METTGIIRKIDELGRITLPIEIRRTLNIDEKDPVEILVKENSIILKKYQATCVFCGSVDELIQFNDKNICKSCRRAIKKIK